MRLFSYVRWVPGWWIHMHFKRGGIFYHGPKVVAKQKRKKKKKIVTKEKYWNILSMPEHSPHSVIRSIFRDLKEPGNSLDFIGTVPNNVLPLDRRIAGPGWVDATDSRTKTETLTPWGFGILQIGSPENVIKSAAKHSPPLLRWNQLLMDYGSKYLTLPTGSQLICTFQPRHFEFLLNCQWYHNP